MFCLKLRLCVGVYIGEILKNKMTFTEAVGKDTDACRTLYVYIGELVGSLTLLFIQATIAAVCYRFHKKIYIVNENRSCFRRVRLFNKKKTVICEWQVSGRTLINVSHAMFWCFWGVGGCLSENWVWVMDIWKLSSESLLVLNSGNVLHFHLFGRLKDFEHKQAKFLLGKKNRKESKKKKKSSW